MSLLPGFRKGQGCAVRGCLHCINIRCLGIQRFLTLESTNHQRHYISCLHHGLHEWRRTNSWPLERTNI